MLIDLFGIELTLGSAARVTEGLPSFYLSFAGLSCAWITVLYICCFIRRFDMMVGRETTGVLAPLSERPVVAQLSSLC